MTPKKAQKKRRKRFSAWFWVRNIRHEVLTISKISPRKQKECVEKKKCASCITLLDDDAREKSCDIVVALSGIVMMMINDNGVGLKDKSGNIKHIRDGKNIPTRTEIFYRFYSRFCFNDFLLDAASPACSEFSSAEEKKDFFALFNAFFLPSSGGFSAYT